MMLNHKMNIRIIMLNIKKHILNSNHAVKLLLSVLIGFLTLNPLYSFAERYKKIESLNCEKGHIWNDVDKGHLIKDLKNSEYDYGYYGYSDLRYLQFGGDEDKEPTDNNFKIKVGDNVIHTDHQFIDDGSGVISTIRFPRVTPRDGEFVFIHSNDFTLGLSGATENIIVALHKESQLKLLGEMNLTVISENEYEYLMENTSLLPENEKDSLSNILLEDNVDTISIYLETFLGRKCEKVSMRLN